MEFKSDNIASVTTAVHITHVVTYTCGLVEEVESVNNFHNINNGLDIARKHYHGKMSEQLRGSEGSIFRQDILTVLERL